MSYFKSRFANPGGPLIVSTPVSLPLGWVPIRTTALPLAGATVHLANGKSITIAANAKSSEPWISALRDLSAQLEIKGVACIHDETHIYVDPAILAPTANEPESPPIQGGVDVWPLVIADMRERNEIGKAKYGTPLQANNGRRALVDLYQELLDAAGETLDRAMRRQHAAFLDTAVTDCGVTLPDDATIDGLVEHWMSRT